MKKLLLFAAMSFSGLSMAEDDNQWFMGIGVGNSEFEESSFNESDNLLSISGGYDFNDNFALEASYIDLGNVKGSTLPEGSISLSQDTLALEANGFTVASLLSWQISAPLSLSAKLGISIFDIDKQWTGGTVVDEILASDTGGSETNLLYGAQLQYKMNDSFSLGLNWDRYKIDKINVDGIYAKINFYF